MLEKLDKITGKQIAGASSITLTGKFLGFESVGDYFYNMFNITYLKGNILIASIGGTAGFFTRYVFDDVASLVVMILTMVCAKVFESIYLYRKIDDKKLSTIISFFGNRLIRTGTEIGTAVIFLILSHNIANVKDLYTWLPGFILSFFLGGYFILAAVMAAKVGAIPKEFGESLMEKFGNKSFIKRQENQGK